jgi:hypothetical protein
MTPLAALVVGIVFLSQTPQSGTRMTHSAEFIHGTLVKMVRYGPELSRTEWLDLLKKEGLKPMDQSDEALWRLKDATGELRAGAYFLKNESAFHLLFFPTERTPIPDALLRHLLTEAAGGNLEQPVEYEIAMKPRSIESEGRKGSQQDYLTVRLQGGSLLSSITIIKWPKQ